MWVTELSALSTESCTYCGNALMKLSTVDNINKVRGASLFPCGQLVCNKLRVVRLWWDRPGYSVGATDEILMQSERDVSHRTLLSIQAGIIRSTTTPRLNHSHYCDSWHSGCIKASALRSFLFTQWVNRCLRTFKSSCHFEGTCWLVGSFWDQTTLSLFLISISHLVINYSLDLSKKELPLWR